MCKSVKDGRARCGRCERWLLLTDFYPAPTGKVRTVRAKCKRCEYAALLERHERYPERISARNKVKHALRDGRLTKEPCEECGSFPAQAHHEDYSRPFDLRWLCSKCHGRHHSRQRAALR